MLSLLKRASTKSSHLSRSFSLAAQQTPSTPLSSSARSLSSIRRCNPALVIFDKDGTLIDFNLMWGGWVESQAWRVEMMTGLPVREKLFDAMGYDWIRRAIRSQGALCCTPMGELYKIATKLLVDEGLSSAEANEVIRKCWVMPDPVTTSRPIGDIQGLFRTVKQMGIKIAVCTTDDRKATEETLQHLKLDSMVDAISCGDDGLPAKPAAEQVWTLCHQLGVEPHNSVMVGDTSTDMRLGRNAGVGLSIGVIGGASNLEDLASDADVLVPSVSRVVKVLFQYGQQAHRFELEDLEAVSTKDRP